LAGEIHLWRAPLSAHSSDDSLLAPDEQARAARLLSAAKRAQFVAGRSVLRTVLARYCAADPASLLFAYGPHGKPALPGGPEFNLAHAGDLLLLAVSGCGAVGVDLEQVDTGLDWRGVAQRIVTPGECAALAALPPWRQRRAFYRLWTRHEALLKATGGGFAGSVALSAGDDWELRNLHLGRGYLAALATTGKAATIHRFAPVDRWG
jgi:4'-phosphopantetheinyl transferase